MNIDIYFAELGVLFGGVVAGFIFGFLLQRGNLAKFNIIVNQLLLRNFTVFKVLLTAIIVGGFGIHTMFYLRLIGMTVGSTLLVGNVVGGLIFGAGMAILGYCPGTCIAACGAGSKDALWGLLGMFAGGAIYAEVYPSVKDQLFSVGNFGLLTLSSITGLPSHIILGLLSIIAIVSFVALEKRGK